MLPNPEEYIVKIYRGSKSHKISSEIWMNKRNGEFERPNGPFRTRFDSQGRITDEEYSVKFFDPLENGEVAAQIRYDPETGNVIRKIFKDLAGNYHRDRNRFAVEYYDPQTQEMIGGEYYLAGNLVNEEGQRLSEFDGESLINDPESNDLEP